MSGGGHVSRGGGQRGTSGGRVPRAAAGVLALALVCAAAAVLLLTAVASSQTPSYLTTPSTAPGDPACVGCHAFVSNDVVTTWRTQNHGRNGVACPVCHHTHDGDFRPNPKAAVCFECHPVAKIHPDLSPTLPARRCMECHTANVHVLPGQGSWFQGGLPLSKLAAQPTTGQASSGTGRIGAAIVVGLALAVGLVVGLGLAVVFRTR